MESSTATVVAAISAVLTALATGVMIWAVYVAPQKAFEAQWTLQQREESRKRRLRIFTTLMATRGNILHYRHVEALNLIDLEFSEPSEINIRDAWKAYLDHLGTYGVDEAQETDSEKAKQLQNQREERRKDLLAELLQKMGAGLGYGFDFTYLKGRAYYPQGHENEAEEQTAVRKGLIQLLWKGRPLIVRAVLPAIETQKNSSDDLKIPPALK